MSAINDPHPGAVEGATRFEPSTLAVRLRRVVTGNDARGRSNVVLDGPPSPVLEFAPGDGLYEAWSEGAGAEIDSTNTARLLPLPDGAKLRWFTVQPLPPDMALEQLSPDFRRAFAVMSDVDVQPDTTRHPGMHLTQTLDFIVVISGRVRLLLDDDERRLGPGDVVVQRATNHAWVCDGETPALLAAILIDRSCAGASGS